MLDPFLAKLRAAKLIHPSAGPRSSPRRMPVFADTQQAGTVGVVRKCLEFWGHPGAHDLVRPAAFGGPQPRRHRCIRPDRAATRWRGPCG